LPSWHKAPDFPWARTREELFAAQERTASLIGTDDWLDDALLELAPSTFSDPEARKLWHRWVRVSASPGTVKAMHRMNSEIDVREVLPAIKVPTLILHRVGDEDVVLDVAHYMAERIPAAELVELDGIDHGWWVNPRQIVDNLRPFLTGLWERREWDVVDSERVLATVLFTDIVGSTAKLSEMGDRAWGDLIKNHHAYVRRQLVRYSGSEIDTAGDGFFARFDGPARAIRCACEIADGVRGMGLEIRAGLHTGECELLDGKVGGIAVHIGARVANEAGPGEVLVSSTVKDLVAGSGIRFRERGAAQLKGLLDEYRLFAVERDPVPAATGQ
jgi:class 3 adenylate cyclase